jgi:hypothetical protein
MASALKANGSVADAYVAEALSMPGAGWYIQADLGVPAATLTALRGASLGWTANLISIVLSPVDEAFLLGDNLTTASLVPPTAVTSAHNPGAAPTDVFSADAWHTVVVHYDGTNIHFLVDSILQFSYAESFPTLSRQIRFGAYGADHVAGELYYVTNVKIGTTLDGVELFSDDFSSGDTSHWNTAFGNLVVVADPFPAPVAVYATTAELFRVLKIKTPTSDQTIAAQGDLDTATIEINAEIDWADTHAPATTQQLELFRGVCIDRAADLWRHRESAPGILGVVDEAVPSSFGRYSWNRYAERLAPTKDRFGFA